METIRNAIASPVVSPVPCFSAIETATIHAGKRTEILLADIEKQKHA